MKKILLLTLIIFSAFLAKAQDPTLSVGLETLTLNKGQIDVQALTEIIMEKQKELKQEALKRFMFKFFPQSNYTTKFYVQNCLHILLNEKNPQVIEKEILELTTNYALAMGVAYVIYQKDFVNDLKTKYIKYSEEIKPYVYLANKEPYNQTRVNRIEGEITSIRGEIMTPDYENKINRNKKNLNKKLSVVKRIKLRGEIHNLDTSKPQKEDNLSFGLVLDVTSAALSNIEELKTKGFFKKEINYKTDYFYNELNNKELKDCLDTLQARIKNNVTPYIKSYEIIKEFYANFRDFKNEKM